MEASQRPSQSSRDILVQCRHRPREHYLRRGTAFHWPLTWTFKAVSTLALHSTSSFSSSRFFSLLLSFAIMFKTVTSRAARQSLRPSRAACITQRNVHAPAVFDWKDPLNTNSLFTEDELAIAETAEAYCQERMLPRVLGVRASAQVSDATSTDSLEQRHTATRTTTRKS